MSDGKRLYSAEEATRGAPYALLEAAESGESERVLALLRGSADVNMRSPEVCACPRCHLKAYAWNFHTPGRHFTTGMGAADHGRQGGALQHHDQTA